METRWKSHRLLAAAFLLCTATAQAADEKPNILVIWGDDIGWQNVSAYGMGTMGYTTPNIDSIGMQGVRFTGRPSKGQVDTVLWLMMLFRLWMMLYTSRAM